MQAMIFAAGLGTRLQPFTDKHPKALATVNNKTLLQHSIELLLKNNFTKVIINVHHFAEQIIDHVKNNNGFGIEYIFSDEREDVLETGGGFKKAFHLFNKNENILTINADILCDYNLNDLITNHQQKKSFISLAVSDRKSSRKLIFNQAQELTAWKNLNTNEMKMVDSKSNPSHFFYEKAFSGIALFDYECFRFFLNKDKYSLIDFFLSVAQKEKVIFHDYSANKFIDVGTPNSLERAQLFFLENN